MENYFDYNAITNFIKVNSSIILISSLCLGILTIIAHWRIFSKTGRLGVLSLIPVVNVIVLNNILHLSNILLIIASIGAAVPMSIEGAHDTINAILSVVKVISCIYLIYYAFAVNFRLARAFDHGILFGFGLIFFYPIFILILGFEKSEYKSTNI